MAKKKMIRNVTNSNWRIYAVNCTTVLVNVRTYYFTIGCAHINIIINMCDVTSLTCIWDRSNSRILFLQYAWVLSYRQLKRSKKIQPHIGKENNHRPVEFLMRNDFHLFRFCWANVVVMILVSYFKNASKALMRSDFIISNVQSHQNWQIIFFFLFVETFMQSAQCTIVFLLFAFFSMWFSFFSKGKKKKWNLQAHKLYTKSDWIRFKSNGYCFLN